METQQGVGHKGISTFLSFGAKNVQPDILEKMLVGRRQTVDLLEKYARDIAKNGVNHQVFIVGPRGSGKTHLLRVLYHRINELVQNKDVVVAYFAEEEYGISGYLDFLIRIINAFMRWYDNDRPALETQLNVLRETPESRQEYVAERLIGDYVADKPLLILSENFDTILEALGKEGQSKLRAWLYRHNRISIVATSQATSPDLGREDRPFYGFFSTISLKKLTYEESLELLRNLAQVEENATMIEHLAGKGQAQVRAIHELIKGNHRLLVTFYEFLKANSLADLSAIFMKTMNDLKPYYETFIRFLPAQQQKILHYLALAKIPQKGTDIGKNCFIATTSLTKQLSELQRQHLIDALTDPTDKRNKLYDVSEPLLRIAIEIGEQREGITALFIDFLALYYSHDEIKEQKARFESMYISEADPLKKQKHYWEVEARERALKLQMELEVLADNVSSDAQNEIEIGNKYYKKGAYECAIKNYKKSIEIKPNNALAWFKLGNTYSEQGDYVKAIDAYRRTIEFNPNSHSVWYNIGIVYGAQNFYSQAIEAFQRAVHLKPDDAYAWYNLGVTYDKQDNWDGAINAYNTTIELRPDFKQSLLNLGAIYCDGEDFDQAIDLFQKAYQLDPNDEMVLYNLGVVYSKKGELDQAVSWFLKAVEMKPDGAEIWYAVGVAYRTQKDYEKAIEAFKNAIELDLNDAVSLADLGGIYCHVQEDYFQARILLEKATELKPDYEIAWYNLGVVYTRQNEYHQAIGAFQKVFEIESADEDTVHSLSDATVEYLRSQSVTQTQLIDLETWLQGRSGFEIISSYVTAYRRVVFHKEEKALFELPKEQRLFFEREILKRPGGQSE